MPDALGRKNWLHLGSDNSDHTAAVLFTFTATCRRHDLDRFTYLRDVITRLSAVPPERLDELLPDRWPPPEPVLPSPADVRSTGRLGVRPAPGTRLCLKTNLYLVSQKCQTSSCS